MRASARRRPRRASSLRAPATGRTGEMVEPEGRRHGEVPQGTTLSFVNRCQETERDALGVRDVVQHEIVEERVLPGERRDLAVITTQRSLERVVDAEGRPAS